MTQRFT